MSDGTMTAAASESIVSTQRLCKNCRHVKHTPSVLGSAIYASIPEGYWCFHPDLTSRVTGAAHNCEDVRYGTCRGHKWQAEVKP